MITVKIPLTAFQDSIIQQTALQAILFANLKRYTDGQFVYWENINPSNPATLSMLNHDLVRHALSLGAEILGFPMWWHVSAAKADSPVPDTLHNAVIENEDGTTSFRTWREYHDATHEVVELPDGSILVPSNAFGSELPASIVYGAEDGTDIIVKNIAEYKSLLPKPDNPETI